MSETAQASSTVRDFDFWLGRWSVRNRWLRERLAGSTEWEEFDASVVVRPTLDGIGNEDMFRTEHAGGFTGMSFRFFDPGSGPVGDARVLLTLSEGEPVHDTLA